MKKYIFSFLCASVLSSSYANENNYSNIPCEDIINITGSSQSEFCEQYQKYKYSSVLKAELFGDLSSFFISEDTLKKINFYNNEDLFYELYKKNYDLKIQDVYFDKALKRGSKKALKTKIDQLLLLGDKERAYAYYNVMKIMGFKYIRTDEKGFDCWDVSRAGCSNVESYSMELYKDIKELNKRITGFEVLPQNDIQKIIELQKEKKEVAHLEIARIINKNLSEEDVYNYIYKDLVQFMMDQYFIAANSGSYEAQDYMTKIYYGDVNAGMDFQINGKGVKYSACDLAEIWIDGGNENMALQYINKRRPGLYEFGGMKLKNSTLMNLSKYLIEHPEKIDTYKWQIGGLIAYNYWLKNDIEQAIFFINLSKEKMGESTTLIDELEQIIYKQKRTLNYIEDK